jgi:uncharacterized membrane protein
MMPTMTRLATTDRNNVFMLPFSPGKRASKPSDGYLIGTQNPGRMLRNIAIGLLGLLFLATGTLHFVKTGTFVRIVPPAFPVPVALVYISGVCELLGAIGVLIAQTRRVAGWGLIALLVAVFPANIYMAIAPASFGDIASPAMLWARLPMQFVIMGWVWFACLRK